MVAFATARPTTFSFRLQPPSPPPQAKSTRTHLPGPRTSHHRRPLVHHFTALASLDVSKEDKPLSSDQDLAQSEGGSSSSSSSSPEAAVEVLEGSEEDGEKDKFDKRRLEERFAVLNTGLYECRSCGYRYDQAAGDPAYPIPPGLSFEKLPEDWRCPTCGAAQSFFESKSVEIAGFAQNQQFGLGGNSLTSGQKATLIYGTLLFFFILFLLGYFLQ